MDIDHRYLLYKYCASNPEVIKECGENLFDIQKHYVNNNLRNNQSVFCPILFFASNISKIINLPGITIKKKIHQVPSNIQKDDLVIFLNSSQMNNIHTTQLYIRYYETFKNTSDIFDGLAYYSQYYDRIDYKYNHLNMPDETKAALYYVEYGYWNNINIQFIHPLRYICSYPEYIDVNDDEFIVLQNYFNNKSILQFDPYVYVASNINEIGYLFEDVSQSTENRICKQYTRTGYKKQLSINSFKPYEFLANNIKSIVNLLNENDVIYWDVFRLNIRDIAIEYIKQFKENNIKSDNFNHVRFIEEFVGDTTVNYDKKMNIDNCAQYFVESYIKSNKVRYKLSKRNQIIHFLNNRTQDSLRTIPLSIINCFISLPI